MTSYLANLAPSDGSRAGGGGAISPPRGPARGIHTHTILISAGHRLLPSGPLSLSPRYVVAHAASRRVPAADAPDVRRPPRLSAPLLALALLPRLPAPSRRPAAAPPTAPPPLRHDPDGLRARDLLEVCAEELGFLDGAAARRARPLAARHLARRGRGVVQNGARAVGPGRRGRRRGGGGGRRRTASSGGMRQWRCQASGQSSQRSSSPAPPQSAHASSSQSGQSQSPPTSSGGGAGSRQPTWKRLPHEG